MAMTKENMKIVKLYQESFYQLFHMLILSILTIFHKFNQNSWLLISIKLIKFIKIYQVYWNLLNKKNIAWTWHTTTDFQSIK